MVSFHTLFILCHINFCLFGHAGTWNAGNNNAGNNDYGNNNAGNGDTGNNIQGNGLKGGAPASSFWDASSV